MINLEIVGEGATTKIYRDGDKAIKLYINAPPDEAENEAKLQSYAIKMGLPVPCVYGFRKIDESTTALDMKYIPGKPLMHQEMDKNERLNAIQTLVKLQRSVHAVTADEIPKQRDRLLWKIERNRLIDKFVKDKLFNLLDSLDTQPNKLCHGDFHPLNIMFDGTKYWIIDWVDATSGNPLADACRTYIIFKQYLSRSAGIYLRYFCKEAEVTHDDVLAWLPIIAAARMSENMDNKARAILIKIIDEWNRT